MTILKPHLGRSWCAVFKPLHPPQTVQVGPRRAWVPVARLCPADSLRPSRLQPTWLLCPCDFQTRLEQGVVVSFSRGCLPDAVIKPRSPSSPVLQDSLPAEPLGKPTVPGGGTKVPHASCCGQNLKGVLPFSLT